MSLLVLFERSAAFFVLMNGDRVEIVLYFPCLKRTCLECEERVAYDSNLHFSAQLDSKKES